MLIVITPTGTGAVNRHAVAPVEYMYNGDTAAVAVQYAYLPSWVVMGGNQEPSRIAAQTLYDAVVTRLRQQPPSTRPLLLVYGESLGSFGSEQIFTDANDIGVHADGVLWVGPTRANPLWRRFTAARDAGSPEWRPVYQHGRTVRFSTTGADLSPPKRRWTTPRVVYLQHPSDRSPGGRRTWRSRAPLGYATPGQTESRTGHRTCRSSRSSRPPSTPSSVATPRPATATSTPPNTPTPGHTSRHPPSGRRLTPPAYAHS